MNKIKVVIVAGGKGERLQPLTNFIPKPMAEVNGKPILEHIIELFKKYGFTDFVLCLCYLPEIITNYFGDGRKFGVKITYTLENPDNPLGTAGAITLAKDLIEDTFIVTYADILRDLDIRKMMAFHRRNDSFATLNVYRRESKDAKSRILFDNRKQIVKFFERPSKDKLIEDYIWVNGSFYILDPKIFDFIPINKKSDFGTDIFPELLNSKKLYAFCSDNYFIDVGDLKKLKTACETSSKV